MPVVESIFVRDQFIISQMLITHILISIDFFSDWDKFQRVTKTSSIHISSPRIFIQLESRISNRTVIILTVIQIYSRSLILICYVLLQHNPLISRHMSSILNIQSHPLVFTRCRFIIKRSSIVLTSLSISDYINTIINSCLCSRQNFTTCET